MRARPRAARHRLGWLLVPTLLAPEAAMAQMVPGLPISVELRAGVAFPTGDFGQERPGLGAETGVGAGVALHVHLTSHLAAYGSYDYERYGCGQCGAAGFEDRVPEAGFEVGMEWILPFRRGALDPWLGAGVLIGRRLEIPDTGDGFASNSATGWSVGAGLRVPVARSVRLVPGIRYRWYSARFDFSDLGFGLFGADALTREVQVASVALEVGLAYEL